MPKGLDIHGARAVIAVFEEGNYTRAARREKVTQPAITQQIARLEADMGIQLFVHVHHRMQPTHACERILPLLRKLVELADLATSLAHAVHRGNDHLFRLAYTPYVNYSDLAEIISTYDDHFPLGSLDLLSHYTAQAVDHVLDGKADAAIVSLPVQHADLKMRILAREHLHLCLPAAHPLAAQKTISLSEVNDQAFIWVQESYHPEFYRDLMRKLDRGGYKNQKVFFVSTLAEVTFSVQRGLGFALLRESSYPGEGLKLVPIEGTEIEVTTAYIYHAQNQWLPLKAFSEALARTFTKRQRPRQRALPFKARPTKSSLLTPAA